MAKGSFDERINALIDDVGSSDLTATYYVDQPYAAKQHEDLSYFHDDGGPKFVELPWLQLAPTVVQGLADSALNGEAAMARSLGDSMETMDSAMGAMAPTESTKLDKSGGWTVESADRKYIDRQPLAPRQAD